MRVDSLRTLWYWQAARPERGRRTLDLVRLERAVIGYRTPLLPPLDLTLRAGATLGVLGPNGAGKTALLKSLLGLLPLLGGRRVLPQERMPRVGYVPQRDRLDTSWPLSVLDVVLMGRTGLRGPIRRFSAQDRKSSCEALDEIGVGDLADRPLHALSGGQHQRVLSARAIAAEPELLVLDEPTSAMDPAAERVLLELVEWLKRAHDLSVVLVTHQLTAVAGFATEVALVDRARGLFEVGPAREMIDPQRLGRLYGREVRVARVDGQVAIVIGASTNGENGRREPAPETIVGLGYIIASALVLAILNSPRIAQEAHAVGDILFGNAVTVPRSQIYALAGAGTVAICAHVLFFKELLFVSYDPETAMVQGVGIFRYELLLNVIVAIVISVATRAVGALPVFAFTVVPAAAALMLTENIRATMPLSIAFGVVLSADGYYLSWIEQLPTGATMVVVASVFLLPALARLAKRNTI